MLSIGGRFRGPFSDPNLDEPRPPTMQQGGRQQKPPEVAWSQSFACDPPQVPDLDPWGLDRRPISRARRGWIIFCCRARHLGPSLDSGVSWLRKHSKQEHSGKLLHVARPSEAAQEPGSTAAGLLLVLVVDGPEHGAQAA